MILASNAISTEGAPDAGSARKNPPEVRIKLSWCKGCGLCVDYCNRGVLEMNGLIPKVVKAEKCTRCMLCEVICPDFAIEVRETPPRREAPDGGPA